MPGPGPGYPKHSDAMHGPPIGDVACRASYGLRLSIRISAYHYGLRMTFGPAGRGSKTVTGAIQRGASVGERRVARQAGTGLARHRTTHCGHEP
jgi:hypothetical protein